MNNLYYICKKTFSDEYNAIITNESHIIANYDAEYIHKMRVSLRRLAAATIMFSPFLLNKKIINLKDRVKIFARKLGRVRNLDIFMCYLGKYQQTIEKPDSMKFLINVILKKREKRFKKLKKYLLNEDFIKLKADLYNLILSIKSDTFIEEHSLSDYIGNFEHVFSEVNQYKTDTTIKNSQERLHLLRIAIKHLRYNIEFINEKDASIITLKKSQEQLGIINDCEDILKKLKILLKKRQLSLSQKSAINGYLEYIQKEKAKQIELLEFPWITKTFPQSIKDFAISKNI